MLRAAAILAALAAADGSPPPAPEPGPDARLAARVVAAASDQVADSWPACRFPSSQAGAIVEGPLPDELTEVVGALRRPQTPAEAAVAEDAFLPGGQVVPSSMRVARILADGDAVRSRTRRAALRQLGAYHRAEERLAQVPSPRPGLHVMVADGTELPRSIAAARPQELRSSGAWTTADRRRGRSLLVGAVPDGVTRVEVTLARGRSPWTERRYATAPRLSGVVLDNVVAIPVERPQRDAWVTRMTWRAADGRAVGP